MKALYSSGDEFALILGRSNFGALGVGGAIGRTAAGGCWWSTACNVNKATAASIEATSSVANAQDVTGHSNLNVAMMLRWWVGH